MKPETTWDSLPHETKQAISFLRQWLNEDRITEPNKMVSNEQLLSWLQPALSSPALAYRSGIEEAMRVVEEAKSGIPVEDHPMSEFGHLAMERILVALQEMVDTKGV